MCGASQDQKDISAGQQEMYKTLNDAYKTTFGQQQNITGALTAAFLPILQAGPSQTGFAPGEENALRTQATENVATNYAQAQRATANILASQGGGNTLLPSSTSANLIARNAAAAAQARSQAQLGITQANYEQGYKNWQAATGALSTTANLINPLGYAGQSTGAGSAAATTANQIAQANMSPWTAAIGALGGIGGAALGNWQNIFPRGGGTGLSPIPGAAPTYNATYAGMIAPPPPGSAPYAAAGGGGY